MILMLMTLSKVWLSVVLNEDFQTIVLNIYGFTRCDLLLIKRRRKDCDFISFSKTTFSIWWYWTGKMHLWYNVDRMFSFLTKYLYWIKGVIEDIEEHKLRLGNLIPTPWTRPWLSEILFLIDFFTFLSVQNFDDDVNYNECLRRDPGFSNPTNVQTLIDVLGIDSRPPCSLLQSCQRYEDDS